jgi:prolyl-tRNA synthetase
MRYSNYFIPTMRQDPSDAEVPSHKLLLKAGYIRQLGSGIYCYLPLAYRSLQKICAIIREEHEKIGAQEFHLAAIHPSEVWTDSGRWDTMGDNMFRLKDRNNRDLCLGMTHEEIFTFIARRELNSYKELPQIWYQIQTKFRDEPRPKNGLLRTREFTMKDSYSFDETTEGLDVSYEKHRQAYEKIFDRCGLKYSMVQASSGAMGGSVSAEFVVAAEAGEDEFVSCAGCGYSANTEVAASTPPAIDDPKAGSDQPVEIHTPGQKTIDDVAKFLNIEPGRQIKSLLFVAEGTPILVLVRGDDQLNEAKLESALGTDIFRQARPAEIVEILAAEAGSLGPVGIKDVRIIADNALKGRSNMVCGANKNDYHLTGVTPDVHFQAEYIDLRTARAGEPCPNCSQPLTINNALELAHIFKLGTRYSKAMGATILNREGKQIPIVMGSYGIGVERVLVSAIELYHDVDGISMPPSIAPFQVIITPIKYDDEKQKEVADKLYSRFKEMGTDVILDDRKLSPGVKFKDADLIGIPVRITIGPRGLKEGNVEIVNRRTKEKIDCAIENAAEKTKEILENYS